jgi:hypothetical protein
MQLKNLKLFLLPFFFSNYVFADTVNYFSICTLTDKNAVPANKVVRVKGMYISDLTHGSLLQDEACPNLITNIGHLDESKNSKFKEFNTALFGEKPDYELKKFIFDASGVLSWNNQGKRPTFQIKKIWSYKKIEAEPITLNHEATHKL